MSAILKSKLNLLAFSFLILGSAQAGKLQVFSVTENPVGTVSAIAGLFTDTTPSPAAFQLRLNDEIIPAGEVKPMTSFVLEKAIILCIDQSGSMGRPGIKHIQDALRSVFSKSELQINLALWAFDTEVRKLRDFSKNTTQLTKSLAEIGRETTLDGKTKLYEAIELGRAELRSHNANSLKHLIVITDGKDEGSSITDQVIASKANAQNITIDVIGFGRVENKDSELLRGLAKNTGGQYVHVTDSKDLAGALQKLFNFPAPRVFNIVFRYDVAADGHQIQSTQLEFTPTGKPPVLQTLTQGLSAPRAAPPPVPPAKDKWTINILSINADLRMLIAVLIGVLALAGAYMLNKKSTVRPKPGFTSPAPSPSPAPTAIPQHRPASQRSQTSVAYGFPAPSPGHPAAVLYCLAGPTRGQRYSIERMLYRIGSGEDNELQLSDDYLSRKHASVRYDSKSLYLSDSESRNGTFLNEVRLDQTARALSPGDRIRVGKSTLEVVAVGSRDDSPAPHAVNDGDTHVP